MNRQRQHSFRPRVEHLEDRSVPSASPYDVATGLVYSTEMNARYARIDYAVFLHRTPSAGEVDGWVGHLASGLRVEFAEAAFTDSPEYHANHGGAGALWITGLYRDFLARNPATVEVNSWLTRMQQGWTSAQVAVAFATSDEREVIRVANDYLQFLGRHGSPAEVASWVGQLKGGVTDQQLDIAFVTSLEYLNGRNQLDLSAWTADVFQQVLGRPAAQTEIDVRVAAMTVIDEPPPPVPSDYNGDFTPWPSPPVDNTVDNGSPGSSDGGTVDGSFGVTTDPGSVDNSFSNVDPSA